VLLSELEKYYRIISPTYPVAETIDELVSALERILEQEKIEEYYLLGISMGGMIAQELLRREQKKINKAILANTMSPNPKYNPKSARMITLVKLAPKFILNRFIRKQFTESWHEATKEKQAFWKAYYQELSRRYMTKNWILTQFEISFDFSLNYDYTSRDLDDWSGQLLIINSDEDTTFDEEIQEHLIGLYPQAEIYTIQGAGHVPMLKKEEEYIATILNFLQT
jgi:pimeloyl-ACP methyl ester carboxylesterase